MKVTLTNRDAQRMLVALKTIDAGGEIKFAAQTRMAIAVNINRLMPMVAAYETGAQKRQLDILPGAENVEQNRAIQKELLALADAPADYDLLALKASDLKLEENVKITGEQIAALAPILKGLEEAAAAA